MSSTPLNCNICNNGVMVKPKPIHSYDFSKEGFLLKHCNNCFVCNDIEEIIPDKNITLTHFNNRFLKRLLTFLCNRGINFSYKAKDQLYIRLKDKNICFAYDLAELILLELKELSCTMNYNFVILSIYSHSGANLNQDSFA